MAATNDSTSVDGTYLLVQTNDSQRVLALKPGGTASLVSQGQQVRGYTSGLGAWEMTGPDSARATIIDFNDPAFEPEANGASQLVFDLTFTVPDRGSEKPTPFRRPGSAAVAARLGAWRVTNEAATRFGTVKYHIVWTTKYRYQVLGGDVGLRCRELIRETAHCARHGHPRGERQS